MDVTYSAEAVDLDRPAYEAQAERPNQPIRIRVQPSLLRVRPGESGGNHRSWAGVAWAIECQTAEEAIGVRKALEAFFGALSRHGAAAVEAALTPATAIK